ncbi:MAG: hypothetical protein ACXWDO_00850 [Bacteroidia bacterium]
MLSFITFKDAPEELEIVADEQGIEDLIQYLQGIKNQKDHMHLIIDSEIDPYPIGEMMKGKTLYAKHVRLEFSPSKAWESNN